MALIGTPGKRPFIDFEYGTIRGMFTSSDNRMFAVTGNRLYEFFENKTSSYIGKLKTSIGRVSFAENETQLMLVDGIAGYLYYLNDGIETAGSFKEILSGDYQNGTAVVNIDGYFSQNVNNSEFFILSGINDGTTWDILNAAAAERVPDKIVTIGTINNELWLFGTKSVEVWYNAGLVDFPFARINNAFINIGIASKNALGIINNTAIWLGANDQGQGIVWMATGYIPRRISTHAIEYLISKCGDITDASAWVYQQEGHYFYVLNFTKANKTFCYDLATDMWHERGCLQPDTGLNDRDTVSCHTALNGINYVGDYRNGKIYQLDLDYHYDGATNLIKRIRTGGHIHSDRQRLFFHQFELDLQSGVGTSPKKTLTGD
jgi:hypothetical protein